MRLTTLSLLKAVAACGAATPGQLQRVLLQLVEPGGAVAIRRRFLSLARQGLVDVRVVGPSLGSNVEMVSVTTQGVRALDDRLSAAGSGLSVPSPKPAATQCMHHLWAIEAALCLADQRNGLVMSVIGDGGERRISRRGRRTQKGDQLGQIPDARVVIGVGDDRFEYLIEILTPKYSDSQLIAKLRGLPASTCYFATTQALADRCSALGMPRPRVLPARLS